MSDKVVVRDAIKAFAQSMERRARYGHKRVVAEEVMAAKFMSVDDMITGARRNLAGVVNIAASFANPALALKEDRLAALLDAAADAANYLRMAVEKIGAAEG